MNDKTSLAVKKMAHSLNKASVMTDLSVGHLRNEFKRGKLRFVKSGRRILIMDEDLRRYLEEQVVEQN
jgi:excisionase family DNA binding protein